jgi:hypothetical protein
MDSQPDPDDFHYEEEVEGFLLSPTTKEVEQFAEAIIELEEAHLTNGQVVACLNGTLVAVIKLPTHAAAAVVAAADFCGQSTAAASNLPAHAIAAASNLRAQTVVSAYFAGKCIAAVGVAACENAKSSTYDLVDCAYKNAETRVCTIANDALNIVADTFLKCGTMLKSSAGVAVTVPPAYAEEAKEEAKEDAKEA